MIEVKNIFKKFDNTDVLKDISVKFNQGKTNLVIGKSGSGKTVLIKCIVGLYDIDSGKIIFDDKNFGRMTKEAKKEIRKDVGMLFQGGALFDSLTVMQNIIFPLNMFTRQSYEEKKDRAIFCLKRVNLENVEYQYPSQLSGGMQKRVAIARAIAMKPKYLLCDEPNSGLDPKTASLIDNLISEITEEYNITTIINTHDMNSVLEIGDNIAFIHEGELWWEGDKNEILHTDNTILNEFVFSTELTRRLIKK